MDGTGSRILQRQDDPTENHTDRFMREMEQCDGPFVLFAIALTSVFYYHAPTPPPKRLNKDLRCAKSPESQHI